MRMSSLVARMTTRSLPLLSCMVREFTHDIVPVAEARWSAALQFGANSFVHIVNATLLVFIFSAANSQLYIASRTLYGLALLRHAPKIFRKVNRRGVPMPALAFCSCFACLVFLNASEGPGKGTQITNTLDSRPDPYWQSLLIL